MKQFSRFFVVGISTFLIDIGLLNLLIYVLNFNPVWFGVLYVANAISVLTAISVSFMLNRMWSFQAKQEKAHYQASRFVLVFAFTLFMNNLLFGLLANWGLNYNLSKIGVSGLQMIWNFFLYKYFVFRK